MQRSSSRVLIADDNEFRRERLSKRLQNLGVRPSAVGLGPGGRKAVGAVFMLNPAVVIFNLTMMDLNAIAAIAIMSFISPDVALIAMCSDDDALHLSLSGELGIACYIRRGIDPEKLRGIISALAGWDDEHRSSGQGPAEGSSSQDGDGHRGNGMRVSELNSTWAGA